MAQPAGPLPVAYYPKSCPAQFSCPSCKHVAEVTFHDPDAFAEDEPIGGRNRWMQAAALEQAQKKLNEKAAKALPLARCPKCGIIDAGARRNSYLRAGLPLVAVVPVVLPTLTMLLGVITPSSRITAALMALAITMVLAVTIVLWGQKRLVDDAEQSVKFR